MMNSESVLILVKHAMPDIVPGFPARRWVLGDKGRGQARVLAECLAQYQPAVIIGSEEPKARETAEIVARVLGSAADIVPNVHENERETVGWLGDGELVRRVRHFFDEQDQIVFGEESASAARSRFGAALDGLLAQFPDQNLIVAAHGTVISLFVAERAGGDAFNLWQRLTCPSYVVLSRPELRVLEVVERIDGDGVASSGGIPVEHRIGDESHGNRAVAQETVVEGAERKG